MILAAVANLLLILFDFTYLNMRPIYRQHLPGLLVYDQVQGVESSRAARAYLDQVDAFFADPSINQKERLQETSLRILNENPFARSGQSDILKKMRKSFRNYVQAPQNTARAADPDQIAFVRFWEMPPGPAKAYFDAEIRPLLESVYFRETAPDGGFVDNFIWLDLPFLIFFGLEFIVRWFIAIRERQYLAWFIFPMYNFYDILGLIPVQELRFFRLFRVASIYVRLHKSELTTVGDDIVSRTIKKYSNIFAEEISDMVAIKILEEAQDEVRRGASLNVVLDALEPRREELKASITGSLERSLKNPETLRPMREILADSLEESTHLVPTLAVVPGFLKERITREIGLSVFDAVNQSLASEDGKKAVGNAIDFILDEAIREAEQNDLAQQVTFDILENIKKQIARKKWAEEAGDDRPTDKKEQP